MTTPSPVPLLPVPVAPAVQPDRSLSREHFLLLRALLDKVAEQDRRLAAMAARLRALDGQTETF